MSSNKFGYIYVATSELDLMKNVVKIGQTTDLDSRLCTLNTSRAPGQVPSVRLFYIAVWKVSVKFNRDVSETLKKIESAIHEQFNQFRLVSSEFFEFDSEPIEPISSFISKAFPQLELQNLEKKRKLNVVKKPAIKPKVTERKYKSEDISSLDFFCRFVSSQKQRHR
jgi:hypothetical protein